MISSLERTLGHRRSLAILAGLGMALLSACATPADPGAREYLDERTAATVTVAGRPIVLARERPEFAVNARDYLTLVPVDVNRGGTHVVYFYGYAWSTIDKRGAGESIGQFVLVADGRSIALASGASKPRELGFGSPPMEPPVRTATPLIVATTREVLQFVARSRELQALRTRDGLTERFELWQDGRAEIEEFLAGDGMRR